MLFFDYPISEEQNSDQRLWYGLQRETSDRLKAALEIMEKRDDYLIGEVANALHVLSTYYGNGWLVEADPRLADQYLRESANLGHAQSCYDLARMLLSEGNKGEALFYIKKGLAEINNTAFDSTLTGHRQIYLEDLLTGLKIMCERNHINLSTKPPTLAI